MKTLFIASLTLCAVLPAIGQNKLSLRAATPNQTTVPRYGKLELTLDLTATYDNPFDPDDVDVYAVFTAPNGKTMRVNGFIYQPFTRRLDGNAEKIEPAGEPVWKVRFAPDAVGEWRYQIFAKDRTGSVSLPEARFQVTASTNPGFIRRSATNPRAFAYDNGQPFFAVGENMCWGGGRGSFNYPNFAQNSGRLLFQGKDWIESR